MDSIDETLCLELGMCAATQVCKACEEMARRGAAWLGEGGEGGVRSHSIPTTPLCAAALLRTRARASPTDIFRRRMTSDYYAQ